MSVPKTIYERKCMHLAVWIAEYAIVHGGNSPTLREISEHFKINTHAVYYHISILIDGGYADRVDGKLVLRDSGYRAPRWLPRKPRRK